MQKFLWKVVLDIWKVMKWKQLCNKRSEEVQIILWKLCGQSFHQCSGIVTKTGGVLVDSFCFKAYLHLRKNFCGWNLNALCVNLVCKVPYFFLSGFWKGELW